MTTPGNFYPAHETADSPEIITQAAQAVVHGLTATWRIVQELGPEGVNAKRENRFGETALEADVASEQAMLAALEGFGRAIDVHSEEHGITEVNADVHGPRLLAVMDGLDGSGVYQKDRERGRYGSMFAIFENNDPRYDQWLAAGIMLHATNTLLLAVRGQELKAINLATNETTWPRTNRGLELVPDAVVFADKAEVPETDKLHTYFALNTRLAEKLEAQTGVTTKRTGSTAGNVAAVAMGEAALDLGATRKGNLEFATTYPIVKAAGGVVETLWGRDLGPEPYLAFGQSEHIPVLVAASKQVADAAKEALTT